VITGVTQQPTDPSGLVIMVNCKVASGSDLVRISFTNVAAASLLEKDSLVLRLSESILLLNAFPACWSVVERLPLPRQLERSLDF
jgi:hypothetical protein